MRKNVALRRRHVQALFGAPPQDILGLHGPFLAHQVAHFGLIKVSPEGPAEIGDAVHIFEKVVEAVQKKAEEVQQQTEQRTEEKKDVL